MLTGRRPRQTTFILLACIFFAATLLLWPVEISHPLTVDLPVPSDGAAELSLPPARHEKTEIVVASTTQEDPSWVHRFFAHWNPQVYVADNRSATTLLAVPRNKGREAMAYLTYIVDRYDDLPDAVLFVHASRFQWHNDDPDYDVVPALRSFRLPYLREAGYVNLRCVWAIGCPAEIHPVEDEDDEEEQRDKSDITTKSIFRRAFQELLPEVPVPAVVAVSCCSQFGVTRATIKRHPRERYLRFRNWLLETSLDDSLSGRVMEFLWHIIFGKDAHHCPSAGECYCKVYGQCDLTCSHSSCDGRYVLPPYSILPEGWPRLGWDHEDRGYTGSLD
ncbi:hypothetical protein F4820DRAFT_45227 [Hypoxylon rubiginosum]|uniref:Uncharacterized protein n=1 Tax=Hypoxylon rubiginosum TaxID=110542 RepID=A0ACB9ZCC9_9PEZI|nr:hypothetical protein F4820DRAFT_45227 [Hypoxylon rubiginosum]